MSKVKKSTNVWRKRTKTLVIKCMGNKCQICGYNKCMEALELHHIDPTQKEFNFNKRNISLLNRFDELEKCILLCVNCHREVHDGSVLIPKNYQKLDREYATNVYNEFIHDSRKNGIEKFQSNIKNKKTEHILLMKNSILESGVDFSLPGWFTELSKKLNISRQKICHWIKVHMPEFYSLDNVYKLPKRIRSRK